MYVEAGGDGINPKSHVTETKAVRPVHYPPDDKDEKKSKHKHSKSKRAKHTQSKRKKSEGDKKHKYHHKHRLVAVGYCSFSFVELLVTSQP